MPGLSHLENFLCLFSNAFSQIPVQFTHATVKMMPWPWQTEEERGRAELWTRAANSPNLNFIFTPELPSRLEQNCCPFSSLSKVIVPAMWACLPCASPRESQAGSDGTCQCRHISTGTDSEPCVREMAESY